MKSSFLQTLAVLTLLMAGPGCPPASASFLWFDQPHIYRHHGHLYTHRKWVPANRGFAGFYRYW